MGLRWSCRGGTAATLLPWMQDERRHDSALDVPLLKHRREQMEVLHEAAAVRLPATALERPMILAHGGGVVEPDFLARRNRLEGDEHAVRDDARVRDTGVIGVAPRRSRIEVLVGPDLKGVRLRVTERQNLVVVEQQS